MLDRKKIIKFSQHNVEGDSICECCGKKLTNEDANDRWRHSFIVTWKKHRKHAERRTWNIFRLPRKLKKKFRKLYPGMKFQTGPIQMFCSFKNDLKIVRIYRDNQGYKGKVFEYDFQTKSKTWKQLNGCYE